jgi:hypothetical protein
MRHTARSLDLDTVALLGCPDAVSTGSRVRAALGVEGWLVVSLMPLAIFLAQALGGPDAVEAAQALVSQCQDAQCVVEGMTYFAHESSLSRAPKPMSHDAKDHTSCGLGQTSCAITPTDVPGQVRVWLDCRAASLAMFGDLRGLPGATPAGVRVAQSRATEAYVLAALTAAGVSE